MKFGVYCIVNSIPSKIASGLSALSAVVIVLSFAFLPGLVQKSPWRSATFSHVLGESHNPVAQIIVDQSLIGNRLLMARENSGRDLPISSYERRKNGLGMLARTMYDATIKIDPMVHAAVGFEAGFPCRCFFGFSTASEAKYLIGKPGTFFLSGASPVGLYFMVAEPNLLHGIRALGFSINLVFWISIILFINFITNLLVVSRRVIRGRCARCAYPVGDFQSCSECGLAKI